MPKKFQKRLVKIRVKHLTDDCDCMDFLKSDIKDLSSSMRYSNADIRKHGRKKVEKRIDEDMKRYRECGESYTPLGILADAEIHTRKAGAEGGWLVNYVKSGGLWCVESDSDAKYIKQVQDEQIDELRDVLKGFGFTDKQTKDIPIVRP